MWRRQQGVDGEEAVAPMDTAEQEELISSLRNEATHQDVFIRRSFVFVFLVVATIFCGCFISSLLQPFAMVHQQRFEGKVSIHVFSAYYFISILTFITAAIISQVSSISSIYLCDVVWSPQSE